MQNALQNVQLQYNIYNQEIEPEHESDYPCSCAIHNYQRLKWARIRVLDIWANAVMYPGTSRSSLAQCCADISDIRREDLQ